LAALRVKDSGAPGLALRGTLVRACVFLPARIATRCYRPYMAYPLTSAQTHLGELVAEARQSHRPVTISENGEPVAALIDIDDLADLQDRAALAAHLADKAAGRDGISLDELDAALDQIDASTLS
jgi:prevent-host-death family protein